MRRAYSCEHPHPPQAVRCEVEAAEWVVKLQVVVRHGMIAEEITAWNIVWKRKELRLIATSEGWHTLPKKYIRVYSNA